MTITQIAGTVQDTRDNIGARDTTRNPIFKRNVELIQVEENATIVKTNTLGNAWIVGSATNGLVGTNTATEGGGQQVVGDDGRVSTIVRIVNPNNIFREHFRDDTFLDNATADWNTTLFRLAMTTATDQMQMYNTQATSKTIFTNNATINKATVNSTETLWGNDTVLYYLSADGGSNWQAATAGVEISFDNTGTDLRVKVVFAGSGASSTYIENLKVSYVA